MNTKIAHKLSLILGISILLTGCGYQTGTITNAIERANDKIQSYKRLYCEAATPEDRAKLKKLIENLGGVVDDDYCE